MNFYDWLTLGIIIWAIVGYWIVDSFFLDSEWFDEDNKWHEVLAFVVGGPGIWGAAAFYYGIVKRKH